ncbi:MAG: hypothetical protein AAF235_10370, partial [Planctomycetota bacterium]
ASFILDKMVDAQGLLARSTRAGKTQSESVLEDYAYVAGGLLLLSRWTEASAAPTTRWLDACRALLNTAHEHFAAPDGGYDDTPQSRADLFVRARTTYDGAVPSGTGVLINNLASLARLEPEGPWLARAINAIRAVSAAVADQPVAPINSTRALLHLLRLGSEVADAIASNAAVPSPPAGSEPASRDDFTPVEVYASTERVTVAPEQPAVIDLVFRIQDGWHILAAEPVAPPAAQPAKDDTAVPAGLVPLRVGLVSGQGVAVYGDYQDGEPYGAAFAPDELRVHKGTLEMRVLIERAEGIGAGEGPPILGVTFQACTDTECRRPTTVELDVAIDLTDAPRL